MQASGAMAHHITGAPAEPGAPDFDLFVDGSCAHFMAIGAAAVMVERTNTRVVVSYMGLRGRFVGPATSELVALLLGFQVHRSVTQSAVETEPRRVWHVRLHTDSERVLDYLHGHVPTTPEGRKLLPLITLARAESARHPEVEVVKCHSKRNEAHSYAINAMRTARDNAADQLLFTELDARVYVALNEVEALTRAVH